jgi:hypothetical protein
VPCNGTQHRQVRVTIEDVDYVSNNVPHTLRFHWEVLNDSGRGTDMHYVYQPGAGLVVEFGNE